MNDNWKNIRLEDVCNKIGSGVTPSGGNQVYKNVGVPLVRSQNIYNNYFNYKGLAFIEEEIANKMKNVELEVNDVLINITGDSVARCTLVPPKIVGGRVNQHVSIIRTKKDLLDPDFLKYYLVSSNMQSLLLSMASEGATRPALTKKMLENLELYVPEIDEQKKISTVLNSFSNKIELNNDMNTTLEEMAQAIFKAWFVDFEPYKDGEFEASELGTIPKGWTVGTVGDFIEVNPQTSIQKGKTCKFVDMGNVPMSSARINEIIERAFTGGGSRFKNNDVIFARITPCLENGKTAVIDFLDEGETAFGSTEFLVFRGINWNAMYYGYCLSRYDKFRMYAVQHMNGSSGRQRVSKGDIENYKIVIPPMEELLRFNEKVAPYFEKIKHNDLNSNTLKSTRDLLLPKLISGEMKL
jgi:type I restriction enzyme, S subunit